MYIRQLFCLQDSSFETYQNFQDVDFVDKGRIVLDLFLLDRLDCKLLVTLSMLGQIDNAEASIGKFLLERIDLFNVTFCGVHKVLGLVARCLTGPASAANALSCHRRHFLSLFIFTYKSKTRLNC